MKQLDILIIPESWRVLEKTACKAPCLQSSVYLYAKTDSFSYSWGHGVSDGGKKSSSKLTGQRDLITRLTLITHEFQKALTIHFLSLFSCCCCCCWGRELLSMSAKAHWHSRGTAPSTETQSRTLMQAGGRHRCGLADLSLTPLLPAPWPLQLRKDREVIIGGSRSTKAAAQRQLQRARERERGEREASERGCGGAAHNGALTVSYTRGRAHP